MNVNKAKNITTEIFLINSGEQSHTILILLFNVREKLIFNQYLNKTTENIYVQNVPSSLMRELTLY